MIRHYAEPEGRLIFDHRHNAAMRDVRTKRAGDVGFKPGVFDPELGR